MFAHLLRAATARDEGLACLAPRRRGSAVAWTAAALVLLGVLHALGPATPLLRALRATVRPFAHMRTPQKFLIIAHAPFALLVALGAERALRGIAVGRKNWLFAGSDRGGERAAAIYTLIATAKLNDIDPQAWLEDVLRRIADHPANRLADLLPWNWRPQTVEAAAA